MQCCGRPALDAHGVAVWRDLERTGPSLHAVAPRDTAAAREPYYEPDGVFLDPGGILPNYRDRGVHCEWDDRLRAVHGLGTDRRLCCDVHEPARSEPGWKPSDSGRNERDSRSK